MTPIRLAAVDAWLDRCLRALGLVLLPLAFLFVCAWALLHWGSASPAAEAKTLPFQVLHDAAADWSPEQAKLQFTQLSPQPTLVHPTEREPAPFWLLIRPAVAQEPQRLELPSRHLYRLACWDASTFAALGSVARSLPLRYSTIAPSRAGFALDPGGASALLCRAELIGPGRISVLQWQVEALAAREIQYQRSSGLLDGGVLVLALFALLAGLINRNASFLLLAAWLLLNLRMAALSMGWDTQWLGLQVPHDWQLTLRPLTKALYAALTLALFSQLFRSELQGQFQIIAFRSMQWLVLPIIVMALLLPFTSFLPIFWLFSAYGGILMLLLLLQVLHRLHSPVALFYAAAVAVSLLSGLQELALAALGYQFGSAVLNSVTAALASSLLASLALAEQMRQAQRQRLLAQAQLQQAYAVNPVGLFSLDLAGRFCSVNPALQQMLGRSEPELLQQAWANWFGQDQWHKLLQETQGGNKVEMEVETSTPAADGLHAFQVRVARAGDRIEGSLLDITEKKQANQRLQFLALHDPLTKVLNRRGIENVLGRALEELAQGYPLAVAYLDLDRFKLINDLYGHAAGDTVLQIVCQRARHPLQAPMELGRVGGDEFLLVFGRTPLAQAEAVCRTILEQLGASPCIVGERAFQVRGSIGLIEVLPGSLAREVVSSADHACRLAKKSQNKGLVVFDRGCGQLGEHEAELQLIEHLENQQSIEGLYLHFQPIMSLRTPYSVHNFEVLLRMQDAQGGRVPTARLIQAAENAGRMSAIDRWVLEHALHWLQENGPQLQNNQFACINLSAASLNDEHFVADVFALFERYPQATQQVCLEITESVALHDMNNTRHFIERVRAVGAKVALDDFGAGYTSFSYLKDLPADLLKIDGSFIVKMNQHPANVAIVEAIVSLARNLGMQTIAEWAEDHDTVATLAEIGVDYVQGYVIAQPMPPQALLNAQSGADFVADPKLKSYLSHLFPDEMAHVDLVLGHDPHGLPKHGTQAT